MENWKFALSSIMGHKMRSVLTMLGIIIGVAAVVIIMGLGNAMKQSVMDSYSGDKKEVQIYYQTKDEEDDPYAALYSHESTVDVKEEWLEQITKNLVGVDSYYFSNSSSATISYKKNKIKNVTITGVSKNYFSIKDYDIMAGRQLQRQDYSNFSRIVMIDTVLSDQLFGKNNYKNALNKVIDLGGKDYLVVGVFKTGSSSVSAYGLSGTAVMANTQVALEYNVKEVGSIYIHVKDASQSQVLGKKAAKQLTKLSQVKDGKYTVADMSQFIDEINQQFGIMTAVIGSIAGISLIVGGIGVMNIMLVSVTERTREIGLRKALGATRGNILTQFLIESVVLTIIGGLFGLVLARLLVGSLGSALNLENASVSLNVAIISIVFSASIGIVFGLLPANKASKLDPIEALRYE